MKYALIGCGRISINHIAAAIENDLELVAISDILEDKMFEKIEKMKLNKDIKKYTDYKEMLKNEQIDLVAIATESGKHAKIALDCINCGCNVIIEKPIALSLKDADEINIAAKNKNVKVCACHQNRFNKSIQKVREAIESNKFGKLFHATAHIRWNRNSSYYTQAPWRGTWEQDGGCLMNQCIHNIDLLRWMMGDEIEEVVGFTDNLNHDYINAEDLGLAMVKFKNGSYGIVEGTTNVYPKNFEETLYIFGEKGTVKVGGKSVNVIDEWLFNDQKEDLDLLKKNYSENPENIYGFGHKLLYADVISAIEKDREPLVDGYAGRRALELVLAIYKSANEGKIVKLPLKETSTLDFKGRFKDE